MSRDVDTRKVPGLLLVLVCLALMVAGVQAYEIMLDTPTSVQSGSPLLVNGTTNLPTGIGLDIVLWNADYHPIEIDRKHIVIEHSDDTARFSVTFNTTGLPKGVYKVEVPNIQEFSFLGSSVTIRPVIVIDRSDEIVIAPPLKKEFDGTLTVAGNGARMINSAVNIMVTGLNGSFFFGPVDVNTDYMGSFSETLRIPGAGDYHVRISDARGFITNITYSVTEVSDNLPVIPVAGGAVVPTATPVPSVSAQSPASRDSPAIFAVISNPGMVRVYTSTGTDWVIEYLDHSGTVQRVHQAGLVDPESLVYTSDGNTTWIKVYPYKYDTNSTVTLYGENALDIRPLKSGTDPFPAPAGTTRAPDNSQTSPLLWLLFPAAVICGIVAWMRARRQ